MDYRQLGKAGIKLSEISLGSWLTFGTHLDLEGVKRCMWTAFDLGVNFFDNAEVYAGGVSEVLMGEVIREFRRQDLVISTKIFWGGEGVNDVGLSWKRILEGTKQSLRRLQLDYVDLLFCHRPDPATPIEETVRAMDVIIRSGLAFYWGTSEWSSAQVQEAYQIAKEIGATPPSMEQPEYNLFHRYRVEHEYAHLYKQYGMGITTWGPLHSGILTGKYNQGIPAGTRLAYRLDFQNMLTPQKIKKIEALAKIAEELNCSLAQLSIAWCLRNPHVSSVITGATHPRQIEENMKASAIKHQLEGDVLRSIEDIIGVNDPDHPTQLSE